MQKQKAKLLRTLFPKSVWDEVYRLATEWPIMSPGRGSDRPAAHTKQILAQVIPPPPPPPHHHFDYFDFGLWGRLTAMKSRTYL